MYADYVNVWNVESSMYWYSGEQRLLFVQAGLYSHSRLQSTNTALSGHGIDPGPAHVHLISVHTVTSPCIIV